MNQISNSNLVVLPEAAFVDCDNTIYTHKTSCYPRMMTVAGNVVGDVTGMSKWTAMRKASTSFKHCRDAFYIFRETYGEEKYRAMHREFDRAAQNDTYGVMNPAIPDLIEELSEYIPVYVTSHTTGDALKSMLGRMGFSDDLIHNRAVGMDSFEKTHGWARKDRNDISMLQIIADRDGLDMSRSVLFEDSATNIHMSMEYHGLGQAYKITPDTKGGDLAKALRHAIHMQESAKFMSPQPVRAGNHILRARHS